MNPEHPNRDAFQRGGLNDRRGFRPNQIRLGRCNLGTQGDELPRVLKACSAPLTSAVAADRCDANPVPDHCVSDLFLIRELARTVRLPPIAPNMDLAQQAANDGAYSTDVQISTIMPR